MAKKLTASKIAALLREFGQRTALRGGNPYRAKAYVAAASSIKAAGDALPGLIERGELQSLPRVGDAIADIVTQLYKTGTHPRLEEMREEAPASLLELTELPGVRPEQIIKIYRETGIAEMAMLEAALREGAFNGRKGFTPAFQNKLLQAIEIRRQHRGRMHLPRGWQMAETARRSFAAIYPDLTEFTIAGECRRNCELVGDPVLVAIDEGEKYKIKKEDRVELRLCKKKTFGSTLLFATGPDAHITQLQKLAQKMGMTLGPAGLKKGRRIIASETEAEIYRALGLAYIDPELREGRNEIELARENRLPKLAVAADIRGVVHAHTVASDGSNTLEDMAEAAQARGYHYFGVTDHSKTAHYAGGLKPEEITAQHREIDRLNRQYGGDFRIFKGIESDILPDGSLDYPDGILGKFDFIVASVHGQFRLDPDKQTQRIISAVKNPYTTILGHITGRQLLRRYGYDVDVEAILKACAEHSVAIEINANPLRLELDWRWHQTALELGCTLSIDPDAHSTSELDYMRWGVAMARKGGVPPDRILNCLDLDTFAAYLNKRRPRKSRHVAKKDSEHRAGL
jgi:DNA polymerase (family 10)